MSMFLLRPYRLCRPVQRCAGGLSRQNLAANDVSSATIAGTRPGTSDSAELLESRVALGVEYN